MYEDMKWVAEAYRIKCSKYYDVDLSPELRDTLFDEAFNEYCTMNFINSKSCEGGME